MLSKLFKHEFQASVRVYGLLYLLMGIYTCLMILYCKAFSVFHHDLSGWLKGIGDTVAVLLMAGYVVLLIGVNILTLVYLIYRFYQTMVSDEGYLTHTLPVTTGQLIFVKLITAFCFQVVSAVVTLASLACFFIAGGAWGELCSAFREIVVQLEEQGIFGGNFTIFVILCLLLAVAGMMFQILTYYMCISTGNLFNGHKVLGSVVVYLVFNFLMGIVQAVVMVFSAWAGEKYMDYVTRGISDSTTIDAWVESLKPTQVLGYINLYAGAWLVLVAAGCGILFAVSRYILKNRLNLA